MREFNSSNLLEEGQLQQESEESVQCNNGEDRQQGHTVFPAAQGLYNPKFESDACGIGFVVNIKGEQSHEIVRQALTVLTNLTHRGATGAEPNTGDGAGIFCLAKFCGLGGLADVEFRQTGFALFDETGNLCDPEFARLFL